MIIVPQGLDMSSAVRPRRRSPWIRRGKKPACRASATVSVLRTAVFRGRRVASPFDRALGVCDAGARRNPHSDSALSLQMPTAEYDMDWNRVEGNWKQMKGKVKEQWGKLTDDDLDVINGRRDQLEGKIQERYGLAKDQVKKDVDSWYGTQRW
jgi:uncharacterized protein YjbJ (UPF0337 family)